MYIYGKNVAKEKINSNEKINKIYISDKFNDKELFNIIKNKKIKYMIVPNKVLDSKVDGLHQGIVIDVDDVETFDFDYIKNIKRKNPLVVMLDHLEDPHNFGAIIRTCECVGATNIIIPKDRSVTVNDTVVKVSVGAINYVKIILVSNIANAIERLQKMGYFVYGADMGGKDYRELSYPDKKVLVIGNEGNGISALTEKKCDEIISIPMKGKINSLNASSSAAILLYGMDRND